VNQTQPINLLLSHAEEFYNVTDDDGPYISSYHWTLNWAVNNTFPCKRYKHYTWLSTHDRYDNVRVWGQYSV